MRKNKSDLKKMFYPLLVFCQVTCFGQTPVNDPHWQLVWEDNFNTLNTNIWLVANNFDHYSGTPNGYGEPQVYTNRSSNVTIDNGNLVLKAIKENYSCPNTNLNDWGCSYQNTYGVPYQYTSGWVESKVPYRPKFGYVETRIKLPYGSGLWPAFWLFCDQVQNGTYYQEIDVFEMLPKRVENCVNATSEEFIHNYNHMTSNIGNSTNSGEPFCSSNFRVFSIFDYRQWHTYAVEWSPSKMIFYVDDYPIRIATNAGNLDPAKIILNLALNPGVGVYNPVDFPAEMRVDYVKYYKLNSACSNNINTCLYNFGSHSNTVKGSYIIGGGGCSNVVPSNQSLYFRASSEILINGDFEVPLGSQIYLDVNSCY